MTLPVARNGDLDVPHCTPMARSQGSTNVLVNGRPCQRIGDFNTGHTRPGGKTCVPDKQPIFTGGRVLVNGRPIGRAGDLTCTAVAKGSPNVLAG